jgi:hypothetical protein
MKHGVYNEGNKFKAYVNGVVVYSARMKEHAEYHFRKNSRNQFASFATLEPEVKAEKFHINQRFDFLKKTVKMVAKGIQASAVISGSGGLGKSYSVRKALLEAGLEDLSIAVAQEGARINRSRSFVVVKGYSTAKGLFRTLYENNDGVVIFDDCDSVLKDPVALNLLKSALDSYDTRVISWNADMRDEDLPRSFLFTGRVIFISNMTEDRIDQAIRSRSAVIDVTMDSKEIVDRMAVMIEDEEFMPQFDLEHKKDALVFISEKKEKMKEINLRTLITVAKVRASDEDGTWQQMATYLTCR